MLRTLNRVRAAETRYPEDLRLEEVDGDLLLIQHSTTTHIATVEGAALEALRQSLERSRIELEEIKVAPGENRLGQCDGAYYMLVQQRCPDECHVCYLTVCLQDQEQKWEIEDSIPTRVKCVY